MNPSELQSRITTELETEFPEMRGAKVRMFALERPPPQAMPVLGSGGKPMQWYQWVGEVYMPSPGGGRSRRRMIVFTDESGANRIVARSR